MYTLHLIIHYSINEAPVIVKPVSIMSGWDEGEIEKA